MTTLGKGFRQSNLMATKDSFLGLVKAYIQLNPTEEKLISSSLRPKFLKKGELLLQTGQYNSLVSFLDKGLLRSFYYDESGNEITAGFFQEGKICTDLNSFVSGGHSERSIEALMDCHLQILDFGKLAILREEIAGWQNFEKNYIANLLLQKVNFQREMARKNKTEAYDMFIQTYRQAALFAPQNQIASFLGISPFTLSRIKNR